ncbi:hypothetical protein A2U01_0091634, partial [Trifolium medium]|nr:hypothetical protein [Trifolium medium]
MAEEEDGEGDVRVSVVEEFKRCILVAVVSS